MIKGNYHNNRNDSAHSNNDSKMITIIRITIVITITIKVLTLQIAGCMNWAGVKGLNPIDPKVS